MRKLKGFKHTRYGDKAMKERIINTVHGFFSGVRLDMPFIAKDGSLGYFSVKHKDLADAIYKLWKKY